MNKTPYIVLLLAGGKGCRMHSDRPKQFLEVAGATVISYPLKAFQQHDEIDKIYVVCSQEWSDLVHQIAQKENITKFIRTLPAGSTSIDSIRNGIEGIRKDNENTNPVVMLHEAVRPLISSDIITQNLQTFREKGNAITAIRSHEAYMVSTDGISSTASIPREELYRAQTPQTFCLKDIETAFDLADRQGLQDSQSLYTLMTETLKEQPLYMAQGSELNFKVTVPEDIKTLKAILTYRKND